MKIEINEDAAKAIWTALSLVLNKKSNNELLGLQLELL